MIGLVQARSSTQWNPSALRTSINPTTCMKKTAIRNVILTLAFALCATVQAQPRTITNSLVVHLTFDNTLNDDSGRGNNAAYVSTNGLSIQPASPTFVPGKL